MSSGPWLPPASVLTQLREMRVGVLLGGTSPERAGSLVSGGQAAAALRHQDFDVLLIDPAVQDLVRMLSVVDVVLVALHGPGGEDGHVQGLLAGLAIPHSGSGVLASAVGMHKPTFKHVLRSRGVDTPAWVEVDLSRSDRELGAEVAALGVPVIVKPAAGGGSLGCAVVRRPAQLGPALAAARRSPYREFLAEEYLPGTDLSVAVLVRAGEVIVLDPLEITTSREFYDYEAKHDPAARDYFCPARLPDGQLRQARRLAVRVCRVIGVEGVARVDMIASGGRLAVLEVNTVPGLSEMGNLATMAAAAGIGYDDCVLGVLGSALTKV